MRSQTTVAFMLVLAGCSHQEQQEVCIWEAELECDLSGLPSTPEWGESEQTVLEMTNALRATGGCCGARGCFPSAPPLERNMQLTRAARSHAQDMADHGYFAHESRDGRSTSERVRCAGFEGCVVGENLGAGRSTPEATMEDWMQSPEHCENLLIPDYRFLGVGYVYAPEHRRIHIWVQNLGG